MVTRNSDNTLMTEFMTYKLQVYRQLMITYVPNDFTAFLTEPLNNVTYQSYDTDVSNTMFETTENEFTDP